MIASKVSLFREHTQSLVQLVSRAEFGVTGEKEYSLGHVGESPDSSLSPRFPSFGPLMRWSERPSPTALGLRMLHIY